MMTYWCVAVPTDGSCPSHCDLGALGLSISDSDTVICMSLRCAVCGVLLVNEGNKMHLILTTTV